MQLKYENSDEQVDQVSLTYNSITTRKFLL